jgi:hypothetical protein
MAARSPEDQSVGLHSRDQGKTVLESLILLAVLVGIQVLVGHCIHVVGGKDDC